jgi:hypothetical protein
MQTTREYSLKEVERLYGYLAILEDLKLLQGLYSYSQSKVSTVFLFCRLLLIVQAAIANPLS